MEIEDAVPHFTLHLSGVYGQENKVTMMRI